VFHAKNGWERNEVKDSFLKLKFGLAGAARLLVDTRHVA
jgi:hypothetical protein